MKKAPFVAIKQRKTLLIAAYQEHRTGKKEVRVIAVVERSETPVYHCIFRCQNKSLTSEGLCSIHWDHFGFKYGTGDIMCPLPSGCEAPSHIALASAALEETQASEFLQIQNREARSDSFPFDFTVCISTMYNYNNVLQLVQNLEMLQLLGVNRVVIYKTNSSAEIQRILDYYTEKGLVEVIPWSLAGKINVSRRWKPEHGPGDLHYFGQIPALNDCLYRYMYKSRYVALHDSDELILPQSVSSWTELIPELKKKYYVDHCFIFENNVFPSTIALPPQSKCCPGWDKVPGTNILAHLHQLPVVHPKENYKIIVNPREMYAVTVHGVLAPEGSCSWVDRNVARMFHTRASEVTEPNELIYDDRLLAYQPHLIPAVDKVLTENGFLQNSSTL